MRHLRNQISDESSDEILKWLNLNNNSSKNQSKRVTSLLQLKNKDGYVTPQHHQNVVTTLSSSYILNTSHDINNKVSSTKQSTLSLDDVEITSPPKPMIEESTETYLNDDNNNNNKNNNNEEVLRRKKQRSDTPYNNFLWSNIIEKESRALKDEADMLTKEVDDNASNSNVRQRTRTNEVRNEKLWNLKRSID